VDIASGIAAVGQAISITKSLRELEKSYDAALYKSRIVELLEALIEAKSTLADAKLTIEEKEREIESLRSAFGESAHLERGDGDYRYKVDDQGHKVGFPICPKCEATAGKIVQLKQDVNYRKAKCPVCDASFSPVTCYLSQEETNGSIDTLAKRVADNQRKASERMAQRNRSSWVDSRFR
jgi:DNA repair exonuclease SbcCD ATPase subunit